MKDGSAKTHYPRSIPFTAILSVGVGVAINCDCPATRSGSIPWREERQKRADACLSLSAYRVRMNLLKCLALSVPLTG